MIAEYTYTTIAYERCVAFADLVVAEPAAEAYQVVGPHLRHCLDHLQCLLDGIDTGSVDYDARGRDERIEIDRKAFRDALAALVTRLRSVDASRLADSLDVTQSAAPGGLRVTVSSSLARELVFLSGHTFHHLAIMARIAQAHGISLPDERLTMAFSTAAHRAARFRAKSA